MIFAPCGASYPSNETSWIRYVCDDKNKKFRPESFREIYSRLLLGADLKEILNPWRMAALWEPKSK